MNPLRYLAPALLAAGALLSPGAIHALEHQGKAIFIPADLQELDLNSPDSKWSWSRMACTENIVLFWAPGFGSNISTAPDLEGQNMKVDLANLLDKLEEFYHVFYHDLGFVTPGETKADRYRMMVMLDYSLEGTAYGGDYDGEIGALWIAPNRVQDKKLNCIAHELGHSFQLQIPADGAGVAWGGNGIFEMASQWMLWQVNPDWPTDENYHLNAYRDNTHKAFLHIDNIYRSPYVLELWAEKHGLPYIATLFREGREDEDPAMTHMRLQGLDQSQFCDEMFQIQRRFINWDIDRVRSNMRPYANLWHTELADAGKGWHRVEPAQCVENYGFNAIELAVPARGESVRIDFRGEAGRKGYVTPHPSEAGWRYGIVASDKDGATIYGNMMSDPKGSLTWTAPSDKEIDHLWLVVMGAPTVHRRNVDGPDNPGDPQWPYAIRIQGTSLIH